MKQAILRAGKRLGLFDAASRFSSKSLRILGYHGLWTADGAPFGNTLFMPVDQFARRMEWLARSGYPVLDLAEAVERLADGSLPPRAVAITIDDGWKSTHTHMLPILEGLGLPATLYAASYYSDWGGAVINVALACILSRSTAERIDLAGILPGAGAVAPDAPGLLASLIDAIDALPVEHRTPALRTIGERAGLSLDAFGEQFTYASLADLADAQRRGMRIELHTHRHRGLSTHLAELGREIEDNRACLGRACAGPFTHFCYPSGEYSIEAEAALERFGMRSATTTVRGLNQPGAHPLRLRRMLDGHGISQIEFEAYMSGCFELADRWRSIG